MGLGLHPHSRWMCFLNHIRHTTVGRTPLDKWSARRRYLYPTTCNTHNRQIPVPPGGIRTHDLSRRAAVDLRLRPRGHWDRHICICRPTNMHVYTIIFYVYTLKLTICIRRITVTNTFTTLRLYIKSKVVAAHNMQAAGGVKIISTYS